MVLKELAALLGNNLRRNDMLARMGGDEFALILPETAATLGLTVATKLHQAVAEREFDLPVGKVRMTASFGVASYPDDGKTKDQIYSALDAVLYSVKRKGKNLVLTADAAQDRDAMNIFRRGDFLRQAMYEDRIEAFLQPIVDVRQGVVVAFEALARMRDHETVVPAAQFIEVAEELGMAKELDRIVFRKALLHLKTISRADPRAKMFFNLSARSLNDVDWMRSLPALVAEHGIACDKIVLEITEREALTNLSQIRTIIDELRQRDISFALDDFGSGFSSFLYLKYLSVDYVKIDGSFIQQIAIDDRDRIMVQHIHQIAREFGLKTVAEFVEDLETSQILAQIGVDYAQGYFFGYPVAGPSPTEE
jgi:EAL domain-containing protein (putative c-di-GMP-specific phosphodiesterase class I)